MIRVSASRAIWTRALLLVFFFFISGLLGSLTLTELLLKHRYSILKLCVCCLLDGWLVCCTWGAARWLENVYYYSISLYSSFEFDLLHQKTHYA